jgi:DNA-binding beta-propeller fold protein YncE
MRRFLLLLAACATFAAAGTLYLPAYPNAVLVFDEAKGQIVDRIPLTTGTPMGIRLSADHKKIYITTIDHNGIEVIDVATRKVINHFVLNTPTKGFRFWSGAPDPTDKLFYTITKEIDKFPEHFEVGQVKYTTIDLAQQKIVKTVDIPKEDQSQNDLGFERPPMEVSPDGKYLYEFGNHVTIIQADDLKVVDRIDLSRPDIPGLERVHFMQLDSSLDLVHDAGQRTAMVVSTDPVVHNNVFGVARLDLNTRQIDVKPIGPAPAGISGFEVTPDRKMGYAVVSTGIHGTKRCEFWAMDMASNRIRQTAEVPCRTRFTLGISADGKKLYIYGAGFDIEVYDAATLKHEKTWDLNNDVTYAGIVILP